MQKPTLTFEEFLQSQNLDDWPRVPFLDDDCSLVDKLQKDYSFSAISKCLYENAPLNIKPISDLEKKINECTMELKEHAGKILSLEHKQVEMDSHLISPQQTIATQCIDPERMSTQSDKLRKSKVAKYIPKESSNKNVENCQYPGFKVKQLSELPRHLDAADLWDLVIKAQNFKRAVFKVWRKLFLSEASIAVFQDSFWWWFLQQFQTNQEDQDHLFDRIAGSFVGLFQCVPRNTKDAFFQVYPDCLSQVIYVAFCEAFPESTTYFDDEFKDGLVDLIFQWVSGLKPQKFVWKKWNLDCLKKTTVNGNEKDTITRSTVKDSIKSKPVVQGLSFKLGFCWEDLIEGRKSMFASSTEEIKEDRKHAVVVPKESETITKSCYFGPGPRFRHVLFRLGGQSPLISYYLKMHEITNVSSSLTYKMKRTEIYKLPTPIAPTYRDVIKERQRLRREFQEDYTVQQNKHKEAIEEIKQQRKKTDQQFQRLIENKSMHPTELRLSTDILMNELESTIKKKSSSLIPVLEEMNKPQH